MKVHELTFNHAKCGGVVLLRKLFTAESGQVVVLGLCRACHLDVTIRLEVSELFPPKLDFEPADTLRLHGLGVSFPAELLLSAPQPAMTHAI